MKNDKKKTAVGEMTLKIQFVHKAGKKIINKFPLNC